MQSLLIGKPRKHDSNTYTANVYWENKYNFFKLDLKNVLVATCKTSGDDVYVCMKSKAHNNTFADLNATVIDIVKDNCAKWFNNNMSADLIEDYYSNTLVYDKKHGNLIRVKCLSVDAEEIPQGKVCNISLTLKSLRFYKQKFVLEWDMDDIEMVKGDVIVPDDDDDVDLSDDEIPMPHDEDLEDIRCEYVDKATCLSAELASKLDALLVQKNRLDELVDKIRVEKQYNAFLGLCEELENFFE